MPAAIIARELGIRLIETVCVASYHDYRDQGGLEVLKPVGRDIVDLAERQGRRRCWSSTTWSTPARPRGSSATWCRSATTRRCTPSRPGRPLVDTFITEVSQDTWIYFPWDMGYSFQPPIAQDTAG